MSKPIKWLCILETRCGSHRSMVWDERRPPDKIKLPLSPRLNPFAEPDPRYQTPETREFVVTSLDTPGLLAWYEET